MSLFGKSLSDYLHFARTGLIAILAMGVLRFIVGASGVPYDRATHLVSMTIVTALAALIYGQQAKATGCHVVAMTGESGGSLAAHADVLLAAPSSIVARIQEIHGICIPILAEALEEAAMEEGSP